MNASATSARRTGKMQPQLDLPLAPMPYPGVRALAESGTLRGKLVLVRVDYNIPPDEPAGNLPTHPRLTSSLPTLKLLLEAGARPVVLTHRGRPQGHTIPKLSTRTLAPALETALGSPVLWAPDCIGRAAEHAAETLPPGHVLLLENTRFHAGEALNQASFTRALAAVLGPDAPTTGVFVNDAFASIHRAHASMSGLTALLPTSVIGLGMETELAALHAVQYTPARPLLLMLGGNNAAHKLELMDKLIRRTDTIMLGGAVGHTFLAARDHGLGRSRVEPSMIEHARNILAEAGVLGCRLLLPNDLSVAAASNPSIPAPDNHGIRSVTGIRPSDMIMDIGPTTLTTWQRVMPEARSVVWLGSMGAFEYPPFATGTHGLLTTLYSGSHLPPPVGTSILAGDGLLRARAGMADLGPAPAGLHTSAGGLALLEALSGKSLPVLHVLQARASGRVVRA